jgi:hypothetical protein
MEIAVLSVTAIPVPVMRPTIAKLAMLIHVPAMLLITARHATLTVVISATVTGALYAIRIPAPPATAILVVATRLITVSCATMMPV